MNTQAQFAEFSALKAKGGRFEYLVDFLADRGWLMDHTETNEYFTRDKVRELVADPIT